MIRRWAVIAAGAALSVAAFLALVPSVEEEGPELVRWLGTDSSYAAMRTLYSARIDSLRMFQDREERLVAIEALRPLPTTRAVYAFSADAGINRELVQRFRAKAEAEFASLPESPVLPLRLHLAVSDVQRGASYARFAVLPREQGTCTVAITVAAAPTERAGPRPRDRLVGACGLFARFGVPAPRLWDDIARRRWRIAATDVVPVNRHRIAPGSGMDARMVFFFPEMAACSAGRLDKCAGLLDRVAWSSFGGADADGELPEPYLRTAGASAFSASNWPGYWLAALRQQLGDERFAEMWRTDRPLVEAYELVSGRPFTAFIKEQLDDEVAPHRPGPLRAGLPLTLTLLLCVGLTTLGIVRPSRARS